MLASQVLLRGRSAWKGPYFTAFPNISQALKNNAPVTTTARSCTVLPHFVGMRFLVHNGKQYVPLAITTDMVGHKLGEFANTRVVKSMGPRNFARRSRK